MLNLFKEYDSSLEGHSITIEKQVQFNQEKPKYDDII